MGRQQQFQVLKGAVRRTLLLRFHTSPFFSHPFHRERPSEAAGEAQGGLLRLLSATLSNASTTTPTPQSHCNPLHPKYCPQDPSSLRALDGFYFVSSSEYNAASKIGGFLSPELLHHSPLAPLLNPPHYSSGRSSIAANHWASSFAVPLRVSAKFVKKILLLSSGSGGGRGVSRGFASLVGDSNNVEKGTQVGASAQEGGAMREGQGGDEGVSASVSGRDTSAVTTRRKRKSSIRGVEPIPLELQPAGVVPAGKNLAELKEDEKPSDATDNVVLKPIRAARRKRSKDISGENIRRAFTENGDAPLEACEAEASSTSTRPLATERKPLEISAFSKQPELGGKSLRASATPDESVHGVLGHSESKESLHDCNENAVVNTSLDSTTGVRSTSNEKEVGLRSAVLFEPVEEVLRKDTLNPKVVEIPAISAGLGTDCTTSVKIKNDGIVHGATVAIGATAQERKPPASSSSVGEVPAANEADFSNPQGLYQTLSESKGGRPYQNQEKPKLNSIFYRFAVSGWVSDQALSLYINSKFFPSAASRFRKFFMPRSSQELRSFLVSKGATNEALQFLFPLFAEFCIHEFPNEINRYRELVNTADMTKPDAWYPFARAMKRKVVYHKGPTNSGKTYNALKSFMEASSGIYCSPLRLLAMEVFDTVNMQGVYCNLHTGQEKKDVPFANHLACTVEMCYLTRQWDVAVIDEIQMMSDEYRGWAWTRAFLGLQADEIHVCGDPSALPLIRNLCSGTGDDLVEYEYQRFMPLKVSEESLRGDFRNIQSGDCVVAFSRRDIFDIKREVELASKHRCCVVYGALPPETRTQQAKLFNEVDNGYNVLVASDAIGMGLNLNIRRVVFFSLDKFDGDSKKPVQPAQVKQIAGRAGRRGSLYPEGVTTTFFSQDLSYLGSSMLQDFEPATAAGLFPVFEQIELFASQLPNETFAKLLERFAETCRLDGAFFLSRYDNLKRVANMLEKVKGLSLEDRFNFCFAPVNVRDPQSMGALYRYATAFSQKIPVHVEMGVPSSSARDEFELLDLEARHQVLSMYLWLSQHFPGDLFPEKEQAGEMASQIAVLLGQSLVQSSRRWSKRKLSQPNHRGRPYSSTRRPDSSRQGVGWNDGKSKPAENLVRA